MCTVQATNETSAPALADSAISPHAKMITLAVPQTHSATDFFQAPVTAHPHASMTTLSVHETATGDLQALAMNTTALATEPITDANLMNQATHM